MSHKRPLTDEEIQKEIDFITINGLQSEDDFEDDDDDSLCDPNYTPEKEEDWLSETDMNIDEPVDNDCVPPGRQSSTLLASANIVEANANIAEYEVLDEPSTSSNNQISELPKKASKYKVVWKKMHLELNEEQTKFLGDDNLSAAVLDLSTPYSFFNYFFTEDIISNIVEQSNLFSIQKDPSKPAMLSSTEIKNYMGICIIMSLVHAPNIRSYWGQITGNEVIKNTMSLNKFERIRTFIHFNDNDKMFPVNDPKHDRLHKIRPLLTEINKRFQSIPHESCLSVDEQLCSCKSRHFLKQYLPLKAHKWGFKFFVMCGVSGFAYNFELYSGKENIVLPNEPDLGASANVVVRLCRNIERGKNYRVYFDNYYSTIPLVSYLSKEGILCLGTIRRNRIADCKLPSEKDMKKEERGQSVEYVGVVDDVDVSTLLWKDNKIVTFVSNFAGQNPCGIIKRFDKSKKTKVDIPCPFVVKEYNKHMGGVDLLDSIMGRYKILIRSKKWYFRIFYHIIDMVLANSWLLYRRVQEKRKTKKEMHKEEKILMFSEFRSEIALCLCKVGSAQYKRKSGRPLAESVQQQLLSKRKKGQTVHVPPKEVRMDGVFHIPIVKSSRQRCKLPTCKHLSYIQCEKCGVHLCLNKNNNCFKTFHVN